MTTQGRRASVQIARLIPREDDPPAEPGVVLVYIRPVDGLQGPELRTCLRFSSGVVKIML